LKMADNNNQSLGVELTELTFEEAEQWLSFKTPWSTEEATLIFAGHSPTDRRFFIDVDASAKKYPYAYHYWELFKSFQRNGKTPASQEEWIETALRMNLPLPEVLSNIIKKNIIKMPLGSKTETQAGRRQRRYEMCVDAGMEMPTNDFSRLPKGICLLAEQEGVTRQAFSRDVKAHINWLFPRK
jgi:hypothetical protein